jgi:predicted ATPase
MYAEETTLSMEAAPKQKDLEYSLLHETAAGKDRKGICSAVIYGPNAAGKSTLVSAIHDFQDIVRRGSISTDNGGHHLSLVPNSFGDNTHPTSFEVVFTKGGRLFEYSLSSDLGRFGRPSDPRHVISERLTVDGSRVFARNGSEVSIEVQPALEGSFSKAYLENRSAADVLLSTVEPTDLFLDNGFRTVASPALAREVTSWFLDDLIVVDKANEAHVHPMETEDTGFFGAHFTEVARLFGTTAHSSLAFLKREGSEEPAELFTSVQTPQGMVAVPATQYESLGTTRFLNMLPFVEIALSEGKILFMDELDASIHPMAVMSIVNAFHDDSVNVHHAQIVFTTHNPIFLDSNLFRRDEIKFVERDEHSGESVAYALSDFGTAGSRGVRRGEDYQRGYFMGRYGGIRDIDLVPFLKEQVQRGLHMDIARLDTDLTINTEAASNGAM